MKLTDSQLKKLQAAFADWKARAKPYFRCAMEYETYRAAVQETLESLGYDSGYAYDVAEEL